MNWTKFTATNLPEPKEGYTLLVAFKNGIEALKPAHGKWYGPYADIFEWDGINYLNCYFKLEANPIIEDSND